MYFFLRGFFYLWSLLPFPVIYLFSDGISFLLFRVVGYRKAVIASNIARAFPNKTERERQQIASAFYRNFCDTWMETIKILSMTRKEGARRIQVDFSLLEKYYAEGKSVQLYGGHFMNWEYANVCLPSFQPYTFLGVYMPLANAPMEKLMLHLRSRFGSVMLRAGYMKEDMKPWLNKQYSIGLGADQSPGNYSNAYWLNFLNGPTAFVPGPWERTCKLNQPAIFVKISKRKRGYYRFEASLLADNPASMEPGALVCKYAEAIEAAIQESPSLYLWSHKRWKRPWLPEYAHRWVGHTPLPQQV
jgi:Kdo2-lipid IVA lauroyltransferase/acyltransferase